MWDKELSVARQAAEKSGKILMEYFGKEHNITKKGEIDLVTEADLLSEEAILKIIGDNFPDDSILAEEAGQHNHPSDRLWIIDPLDGTTNFAHTFPFFAISIALQAEGELILGLVYNPCLQENFEAVKGKGAFLNGKPIEVSGVKGLRESLIATGFPYYIYKGPEGVMDLLSKMVVLAQGIRRPGSAAIDLCYVAAGKFDGFWEEGLKPWDTAAGSLIVREAGGIVTNYKGTVYTPFQKNIVASNPYIHRKMLEVLG